MGLPERSWAPQHTRGLACTVQGQRQPVASAERRARQRCRVAAWLRTRGQKLVRLEARCKRSALGQALLTNRLCVLVQSERERRAEPGQAVGRWSWHTNRRMPSPCPMLHQCNRPWHRGYYSRSAVVAFRSHRHWLTVGKVSSERRLNTYPDISLRPSFQACSHACMRA
jgi:hypothetical protein